MLSVLTRTGRLRAASLLVVIYALCLVTPTTVVALSQNDAMAHCLAGDAPAPGMSSDHGHHGDANHDHADHSNTNDDGRNHASKCCGMFLVNGVVPAIGFVTVRLPVLSEVVPLFAASLSGQDTDRIDRPPRSRLSL